ncbi:MAG: HAD hydrolase family protein [Simplicispira sp.]|nr:HAD hydrolase family protein [Simplicispira sp.]
MQQTILATDLDGTFLGGNASERAALYDWIGQRRSEIVLIYVTGRSLTTMRDVLDELPLQPDHIISDVGTAVYAGAGRTPLPALERWLDEGWPQHTPAAVRGILARHPHLMEQPVVEGRRVSCFYSDEQLAGAARAELEAAGYDVLLSAERYFDVLPRGVQKGPTLLRTLAALNLPPERTLVAGDTLNDLSLFQTGLQGVIVANREPLLAEAAHGLPNVHWSEKEGAAGVLDALHRIH